MVHRQIDIDEETDRILTGSPRINLLRSQPRMYPVRRRGLMRGYRGGHPCGDEARLN